MKTDKITVLIILLAALVSSVKNGSSAMQLTRCIGEPDGTIPCCPQDFGTVHPEPDADTGDTDEDEAGDAQGHWMEQQECVEQKNHRNCHEQVEQRMDKSRQNTCNDNDEDWSSHDNNDSASSVKHASGRSAGSRSSCPTQPEHMIGKEAFPTVACPSCHRTAKKESLLPS